MCPLMRAALAISRTHTKRLDVAVIDSGYHGNTQASVEASEKAAELNPWDDGGSTPWQCNT